MKQVCFFIIALLASAVSLHAQTEAKGDSIRSHSLPEGTPPEGTFLPETKNYDGFLLDMSLMRMEAPRLPRLRWKYRMQAKTTAGYSVSTRTRPTRRGFQMCSRSPTPPFTA